MTHIRQRRDTAANWTSKNPVLQDGEVGWEKAAAGVREKCKVGDGVSTWTALPYSVGADAPIASPVFTGDPKAPTPPTSDNDVSIATTAFVKSALTQHDTDILPTYDGRYMVKAEQQPVGTIDLNTLTEPGFYKVTASTNGPSGVTAAFITVNGTGSNSTQILQVPTGDHFWHRSRNAGSWTSWRELAPLNSPAFTGSPTAPNPGSASINNSQIATTQWVNNAVAYLNGNTVSATSFALSSGYVATGGADEPVMWKYSGNKVELFGVIKPSSGTFASGTLVTIAPAGSVPAPNSGLYNAQRATPCASNGVTRLIISTSGAIQVGPSTAAAWVSIGCDYVFQ